MLSLKPNQTCPYSKTCSYNNKISQANSYCKGADPARTTEFTCNLIDDNGTIIENKFRSSLDETGKMKVILE